MTLIAIYHMSYLESSELLDVLDDFCIGTVDSYVARVNSFRGVGGKSQEDSLVWISSCQIFRAKSNGISRDHILCKKKQFLL